MAFMLDEGLEFINTAKWEAVDIIAMFKSLELTGLAACIILIAGVFIFANRNRCARLKGLQSAPSNTPGPDGRHKRFAARPLIESVNIICISEYK